MRNGRVTCHGGRRGLRQRWWRRGRSRDATATARAQAVDAVEQAVNSEDAKAAVETRRRARLTGPDCVEFLHHVVLDDRFVSPAQRVRSATVLLEAGGFLTSEAGNRAVPRARED